MENGSQPGDHLALSRLRRDPAESRGRIQLPSQRNDTRADRDWQYASRQLPNGFASA